MPASRATVWTAACTTVSIEPRRGPAPPGRSVPGATRTALRSGLGGGRVVDDGHDLVDVDDDEVLGRGDGEPGTGGLDHEAPVVEELGGVPLGEDREVAGGFPEEGGQGDEGGGDEGGFPGGVGHESLMTVPARSGRSRSRASSRVK